MDLDDFSKELLEAAQEFEGGKKTKQFLEKTGDKLKDKTLDLAKTKVKKETGNYFKSIKRGKVYEYEGDLAVRAYSSDPKAHLIEHGHVIKGKNGKEHGFKKGLHIFETAAEDFEDEYNEEIQSFLDEMLDKHGLV